MWGFVDLALTDVSEELIASILKVEKSASGDQREKVAAADLHSTTSQKMTFFTVTTVKTSNLT
jgi:hypothetical protein